MCLLCLLAALTGLAFAADVFDYDRNADFDVLVKAKVTRGEAVVSDLSFFTVPGDKFGHTAAYLVGPKSGAPKAAILWVHWLGEPETTNRTEFLSEALELAKEGVVSLLIDTMWAKPRWYRDRVLDRDFEDGVAQVAAIRRALDFLQRQPGAEKVPLAVVGHDYGGMYATIAVAQEPRARACVFIACTASLSDWAFFAQKPASMEEYQRENAPLELRTHLASIKGASLLFQFAEKDKYVPLPKAVEFFAAAPLPKQMLVYGGADHDMTTPAAVRDDRIRWLKEELGLEAERK